MNNVIKVTIIVMFFIIFIILGSFFAAKHIEETQKIKTTHSQEINYVNTDPDRSC